MDNIGYIIKTDNNRYIGMNDVIVTKIKLAIIFNDEIYAISYMNDIKLQYIHSDYIFFITKVKVVEIT